MGSAQILGRVEIPLATPADRGRDSHRDGAGGGHRIAGRAGGGRRLGRYVVDGYALQDGTLIVAGAILTAALALVTEGLLALVQRAATPKGLRAGEGSHRLQVSAAVMEEEPAL